MSLVLLLLKVGLGVLHFEFESPNIGNIVVSILQVP
jgi:hypothetical protein